MLSECSVTHDAEEAAVHGDWLHVTLKKQSGCAVSSYVRDIDVLPPIKSGLSCVIVHVRVMLPHFTFIAPSCFEEPAFSERLYLIVLLPLPDLPVVIVIQLSNAVAVHEPLQATENDSPVFGSHEYCLDIEVFPPPIVSVAAAAFCVIVQVRVKLRLVTSMVAVRELEDVFAATS